MFWWLKNYIFHSFCKFLNDEVKTVFWESETKPSKLFKCKVGPRKLFQKWFWSYFEVKKEFFERLNFAFFIFCKFLSDEVEIDFWESEGMLWKLFYKIFFIRGFFREWFSAFIWSFWSFSLQYFRINQMFWMLIFQSSTGADLIIYFIL